MVVYLPTAFRGFPLIISRVKMQQTLTSSMLYQRESTKNLKESTQTEITIVRREVSVNLKRSSQQRKLNQFYRRIRTKSPSWLRSILCNPSIRLILLNLTQINLWIFRDRIPQALIVQMCTSTSVQCLITGEQVPCRQLFPIMPIYIPLRQTL